MIKLDGETIKATMFPDGTSQVWRVPTKVLDAAYKAGTCVVTWDFENEGELMHVAQLKTLLDSYGIGAALRVPFLPYSRQDKHVSNESTFALRTFADLINSMGWAAVETLDAHCNLRAHAINNLTDKSPRNLIADVMFQSKADILIFPDAGAAERYGAYNIGMAIAANKIRNQATGEITGMELIGGKLKGKKVLIVDDICDGGRTFIEVAKLAHNRAVKEVHLYVTHGIFSKGLKPLREAGISRIFTSKGEVI